MKRKKVKSLLALALSFAMVLPMTACNKQADDEKQKDTEKEQNAEKEQDSKDNAETGEIPVDYYAGTELSIVVTRNLMDTSESFNDKPIMKIVEEATGIHINWTEIDGSSASERIDAILASGELPDAFMNSIGTGTLSAERDMFYDLTKGDLLQTYAPNVYNDYVNGGQNVLELLTMDDGSIRSLSTNIGYTEDSEAGGIMWINKAWLDQLNMEVPTTADEFYEVLCAFRDNDMNGNGDMTDEIPLTFYEGWGSCFLNLANSFGIAAGEDSQKEYYLRVQDGEVKPTVDTEEFRAFLEYYHKLAAEGLLDIEGFSQTNDQFVAKQSEGKVGVFSSWDASNCPNPRDYVGMVPFQGLEGVQVRKGSNNHFYGNLSGLVPSADCSNIEALLHWWNYMSSSLELKYYARLGDEGYSWYKEDDGTVRLATAKDKEEEVAAGRPEDFDYIGEQYTNGIYQGAPYMPPTGTREEFDEDYARLPVINAIRDRNMKLDEYLQTKIVRAENVEERVFIETDLLPFINSFIAQSVVDGVTDASWDAFLEDLEAYGYYDWIEWYQGYVDGEK